MKIYYFFQEHDWCRQLIAKDNEGKVVSYASEQATQWSLYGAKLKLYRYKDWDLVNSMLEKVIHKNYNMDLLEFNESPKITKEDVMKVCLEAGV